MEFLFILENVFISLGKRNLLLSGKRELLFAREVITLKKYVIWLLISIVVLPAVIYLILQREMKTPVSYSKTVTPGAIELQCENKEDYSQDLKFHYRIVAEDVKDSVQVQYEYQYFSDENCRKACRPLEKKKLTEKNGNFLIKLEKNLVAFCKVMVSASWEEGKTILSKPCVIPVDTRPGRAVLSVSKEKRQENGIRYYSSPVKITITGSGRNFDLKSLLSIQPVSGIYLIKQGEKAVGWLSEEGSYGLDFMPFQDIFGQSVSIENPEGIGNLVIDKSEPVVRVQYPEHGHKFSGDEATYFSKSKEGKKQFIRIFVTDKNLDRGSFVLKLNGKVEKEVFCIQKGNTCEFRYELPEGIYESCYIRCQDMAGNSTSFYDEEMNMVVDYTKPKGNLAVKGIKNPQDNQILSGKSRAFITNHEDNLSGIAACYLYKSERDDELFTDIKDWKEISSTSLGPDEKAVIYMKIIDKAGNETYSKTGVLLYDTTKPVIDVEEQRITKAIPKNGWHSSDILLHVKVTDPFEGNAQSKLKKISYEVTSMQGGICVITQSGHLKEEDDLRILAKENNSEKVRLSITALDYAGNQRSVHKEFHIDCEKPDIKLLYHDSGGKKENRKYYYSKKRRATIRVIEKNPDFSKIRITGTNSFFYGKGKEKQPVFHKSAADTYEAEVAFEKDGKYQFCITCQDKAGNTSKVVKEQFVIDKKPPEIALLYEKSQTPVQKKDNFSTQKAIRYYHTPVSVSLYIRDNNIKKSMLSKYIKVGRRKKKYLQWKQQDGAYMAKLDFETDGRYQLGFYCKDLAGNKAEIAGEGFIVDRTKPKIKITGVKEGKASNQKRIAPVIYISDKNLDKETVKFKLEGTNYEKVGDGEGSIGEVDAKFQIPNLKEDDIYCLTVQAADLAGNRIKKVCEFSVNRKGSSYGLSKETALLQGKSRSSSTNISLREVNVSKVSSADTEIHIFRNNEETLLTKGMFTRKTVKNEKGWNEYLYEIDKSYFDKEGTYHVGICSKDMINPKKNSMFEKDSSKLRFIIDKTAPVCYFMNIKNGDEIYREKADLELRFQDNVKVVRAVININGKEKEMKTEVNPENAELDNGNGEVQKIRLPESIQRQNVKVVLYDEAGNRGEAELKNILVTSNPFIRWRILIGILLAGLFFGITLLQDKSILSIIKRDKRGNYEK